MYRHSPSRNQRSKGVKIKHVLQICLLLAVCFWLIYQVKHSHDKKKEFDENDVKISRNGDEIIKLGRKDLHHQLEESTTKNEKHDEEEAEEETGVEDEDNKHEEEEQEEDNKAEEKEDEATGGGDDEIDENDQEKSDPAEVDREEDFLDEEKEREEGDEKEGEDKHVEDKEAQTENGNSVEDHDHDEAVRNTHEAREEQYKADDASSAVTHDTQTISSGSRENGTAETNLLVEGNKIDNTEEINVGQNTTRLKVVGDGETVENGTSANETDNEGKGSEVDGLRDNSTYLNTAESHGLSPQNKIQNSSDPVLDQNTTVGGISGEGSNLTITTEHADNSGIATHNNQSDSNLAIHDETENVEAEHNSGSLPTDVNLDETQKENSGTNNEMDGADHKSGSSETEHEEEVHQDAIDSSDSSIPLEEKEVRTDLDTLPEIRTEGSDTEDSAAE